MLQDKTRNEIVNELGERIKTMVKDLLEATVQEDLRCVLLTPEHLPPHPGGGRRGAGLEEAIRKIFPEAD